MPQDASPAPIIPLTISPKTQHMFCDKTNVNQLTALLIRHGIKDIVVCPGSRNGVIVNNFFQCGPAFTLHSVTDERSAAFVAIGIYLATHVPTAVCVTSGSALLNTLPGVAEAFYRHIPLLIISADRPPQWINQLDGQTLPQPGALLPYAPTFHLPETASSEDEDFCNRLANEALLTLKADGGRPAHINIPLSKPLISFSVPQLPQERYVRDIHPSITNPLPEDLVQLIAQARLPLLVFGQYEGKPSLHLEQIDRQESLLVLPELISNQTSSWRTNILEEILPLSDFAPDVVIHVGGHLVNKQLKLLLRHCPDCHVVRIEEGHNLPDTFRHLQTIVRSPIEPVLAQLAASLPPNKEVRRFRSKLEIYRHRAERFSAHSHSDLSVMKVLREQLRHSPIAALHLGNSSVVRNALYFFDRETYPIHCNRGTNGIEGSLSVAAGHSLKEKGIVLALIGDLSFFYDQNALWNKQLGGNLRILLFNNGGGQIFHHLPGLPSLPACPAYIAAAHTATAKGLADTYGLTYLSACTTEETAHALPRLLATESVRPVLLEVFTKTSDNETALSLMHSLFQTENT